MILAAAVVLLVSDRVRPDLVALLVAAALAVTGVLTPEAAFSGFGSRAAVTILAVSILAEGIRASGIAERAGLRMLRLSGNAEWRVLAIWMLFGAFVSLFMNNIAAAALLLPAASVAARRARVAPSRIMMPLAFGTILGGMATLLTSSNLIVSDLLVDGGLPGFGLLDFAPIGVPLVVVGTAYVLLWGRHRLPVGGPDVPAPGKREELPAVYRLEERLRRVRLPDGSPLVGRTLAESAIRERLNLWVTAVQRGATRCPNPAAEFRLQAGDVLELMGRATAEAAEAEGWFELLTEQAAAPPGSSDTVMAEAVLPPRSPLQGKTPREVRFGDRFGMTVLAVWRGDRPIRTGIGDLPLEMGDALLLQGAPRHLARLRKGHDFIILGDAGLEARLAPGKAGVALLLLGLGLAFGVRYPHAIGAILLIAALLMVPLGILTMDNVHRAIEWRAIFLVAGMLPLGIALKETGAAALLADGLARVLEPFGPLALLGGVFLTSALLTQAVVGPAVAAMMGPVAIETALRTGIDARAMGMAVALACSMAFLTPLGHPVNVLVMGPGGYRFADYRRLGLPLAFLLAAVVMIGLPILFGLDP